MIALKQLIVDKHGNYLKFMKFGTFARHGRGICTFNHDKTEAAKDAADATARRPVHGRWTQQIKGVEAEDEEPSTDDDDQDGAN